LTHRGKRYAGKTMLSAISLATELKVGATVEDVSKQTIDSELTLSTVLPA
jgi:hypothetical protein